MKSFLAVFVVALGTVAPPATAQRPPGSEPRPLPAPRHFQIAPAASPIQIDGVLDEPAWAQALTFDLPYEWQPGDNVPPPVKTDFFATYDEKFFYAAWLCHDPNPKAIRAHLMDRDDTDTLIQDDHVVLMLDPFGDGRRAFQFRVNPLAVQADAVFGENEGIEDFSFDMIWDAAARITPEGYVVEIAIPLAQLRFPRTQAPQTWRIDVGRSYPRGVRHRIIAYPRDRSVSCLLCQVDKVTGFQGLEPGRNLEVIPTLTGRRTDEAPEVGARLEKGDTETDLGISVRWGITPNISFNAAVNPDFSQVEADAAQLAANERFALFFPEKRPFFLEGLDLFATPIQALFTRTVADPDWGVKLSGKEGKNAFGVFVAEDAADAQLLLLPSNQETGSVFLTEPVTSAALRYRRDFGSSSAMGVIFTGREGEDYHNRVLGVDGTFRFSGADVLQVQALRSETLYPDALAAGAGQPNGDFSGHALYADFQRELRDWTFRSTYEERSRGFRADSGFVPRVDFRDLKASVQRQLYGETGDLIHQANLGIFVQRTEDMDGELTDEIFELYVNASGPLQSYGQIFYDRVTTRFAGRLFEGLDTINMGGNFQPGASTRFSLNVLVGDTVDFSIPEYADLLEIKPGFELKIGRHLNAKLNHTWRQLEVGGTETLDAGLSELRLAYNFNVRSFARIILQHLDENPGDTRTLFSQLLFSYKLNPQTVLFLGYSDNRANQALRNIPLTETDRTFFMKVGYAWVL